MITHYHVFSEHLPLQPYGLEFNVAEACVFLCDNASLMVASWSREDDDGDAKDSHHKVLWGLKKLMHFKSVWLWQAMKK